MKGGARTRSGPARNPNALRRERGGADFIRLPASGRAGEPPEWPLSRQSSREKALWATEWRRPQAIRWAAQGQAVEVAMYVRTLVAAEKAKAPASMRVVLRQQMDALGLTEPGLQKNRWLIVEDGEVDDDRRAPAQSDADHDESAIESARDRWRLIEGGNAASA